MALLTDAEIKAIQGRLEGFYTWVSSDPKEDCDALLADRKKRTWLLREAERYIKHARYCHFALFPGEQRDCVCGALSCLAEIQEAIEEERL